MVRTTVLYCTACFNSQPPEGGWDYLRLCVSVRISFNSQPPEGGWDQADCRAIVVRVVSTHSRPKAAGRPP